VSCQKHHYGDTGDAVTPRPFLMYVGLEHPSTNTLRL